MFQMKDKDEEVTGLNEIKIGDLLDKEFKITIIKMLTKVRTATHELRESKEEIKNIIKVTNRNHRVEE